MINFKIQVWTHYFFIIYQESF